jgi:DNA-binding transcriptional MocR family regulator
MDKSKFLYLELAERIAGAIKMRTYAPGERLPSVRALMQSEAVSQATAMRAMVELENRGLVVSYQRSGFYVKASTSKPSDIQRNSAELLRVPQPTETSFEPSPVNIQHLTRDLLRAFQMPGLMAFGAAELAANLLPSAELKTAARDALRKHGAHILTTPGPHGLAGLRQAVARVLATRGMVVAAQDVLITAGESDAMALALRAVTKPGDIVAVESPTYFGILQEIEEAGLRAVEISTDPKTGIDVDELIRKADDTGIQAVVLNPTFENPFGCCMQPQAVRAVVEAMGKRSIPIIEDDVYGDLGFEGVRTRALASFDTEGNTIHCGSFSKVLSPGLRVGWCVPGKYADEIMALQERRPAHVSTLSQCTLIEYLAGRKYARHCNSITALFEHQKPVIREIMREHFPAGTTATDPSGGFLFWVEVPAPFDAMLFYRLALGAGISIAPGPIFSASGRFARAFRLSMGRKLTPEVRKALKTLGKIAFEVQELLSVG